MIKLKMTFSVIGVMILAAPFLSAQSALAQTKSRLEIMRAAFASAHAPNFNFSKVNVICAEVSDRGVKNPFPATIEKTGLAYTISLTPPEPSIVMVLSEADDSYIGTFGKDMNYTRITEDGNLISEIVSPLPTTDLKGSLQPDLFVQAYVTCSQVH